MRQFKIVGGLNKKMLLEWIGECLEVPFCVTRENLEQQFQIRLEIRSLEMGKGSDESLYLTGRYRRHANIDCRFTAYYHTKYRTGVLHLWSQPTKENHHGVLS